MRHVKYVKHLKKEHGTLTPKQTWFSGDFFMALVYEWTEKGNPITVLAISEQENIQIAQNMPHFTVQVQYDEVFLHRNSCQ